MTTWADENSNPLEDIKKVNDEIINNTGLIEQPIKCIGDHGFLEAPHVKPSKAKDEGWWNISGKVSEVHIGVYLCPECSSRVIAYINGLEAAGRMKSRLGAEKSV